MTQQFAHLSDLHLTSLAGVRIGQLMSKRCLGYLSWWRRRRHEHRAEVLDAMLRDMGDRPLDQLLVTGDLTHIGLPSEFRQALDWLQRLGEPQQVGVVPGNHDAYVRTPWEQTFDLWRDYLKGDLKGDLQGDGPTGGFPSLRRRGQLAFIGINTGCPMPPFFATGRAGQDQLARLPALLDSCREQGLFRVVYLHHCPLPGLEHWRKRLTDAAELVEILRDGGAELVIHGHGHRSLANSLDSRDGEIPVLAVPSASALGQHGPASAWHLYEVSRRDEGWTLVQRPRHYRRESGEFAAGEPREWRLRRPAPPPAPGTP